MMVKVRHTRDRKNRPIECLGPFLSFGLYIYQGLLDARHSQPKKIGVVLFFLAAELNARLQS